MNDADINHEAMSTSMQEQFTHDPGQPPAPVTPTKGAGLAVAALVLGIIGALMGLIPLFGFLAIILGVVGLVLGVLGRSKQRTGRGMALAGVILSVVAIGLGIFGMVTVGQIVDDFETNMKEIGSSITATTKS